MLDRARPPRIDQLVVETTASLPSGHAPGSTVVLDTLTAIAFGVIRRPGHRAALATVVVVVIAAVGLSRRYLGVHWSTDVLTGWLRVRKSVVTPGGYSTTGWRWGRSCGKCRRTVVDAVVV